MLNKNDVAILYRLILDREPESELVINEKCQRDSLRTVAIDMLQSEEFIHNNRVLLAQILRNS